MRFSKSWTIALKDFSVFRRKPSILYSLVAFPIGVSVGLPVLIWLVGRKNSVHYAELIPLFNAFLFFFAIAAVAVATGLAAYSIVGEKVEKSLEPLLATPTTDGEILLGKSLAAFLPAIGATSIGAGIFMVFIDALSAPQLGYLFYPNWTAAVFLLLATPLSCLFSVETNVLISSKVADVRTATQFGGVLILPFAAIYVLGEINILSLDAPTILVISGALALVDVMLFFLSTATFRREEILTKWR